MIDVERIIELTLMEVGHAVGKLNVNVHGQIRSRVLTHVATLQAEAHKEQKNVKSRKDKRSGGDGQAS
jgi:hypothetical protein